MLTGLRSFCRDETIAVHPRSYETADFIYNPLHYLALLEQKTKALDQAAPLDNWRLADCVHRLRQLMEARMGTAGRREFVQVLRLMEDFHQHQVEGAVSEALRLGAISFDARPSGVGLDERQIASATFPGQ